MFAFSSQEGRPRLRVDRMVDQGNRRRVWLYRVANLCRPRPTGLFSCPPTQTRPWTRIVGVWGCLGSLIKSVSQLGCECTELEKSGVYGQSETGRVEGRCRSPAPRSNVRCTWGFFGVVSKFLRRTTGRVERTVPRHSMYTIYAYIDPQNHPNVGIYGIHGVSGVYVCNRMY